MSRYSIPAGVGRVVRDSNGTIVPGATITVYLAGTNTLVTIYDTYGATAPVGSVVSDASGKFLIFVDDSDYPLTQMFRFVTSFGGVTVIDDYVR